MVAAGAHDPALTLQQAARVIPGVAPEAADAFSAIAGDRGAAERVVRYHRDLVELAHRPLSDAVALDAGCGFGPSSLALAALGAQHVHALDIGEVQIEALKRYLPALDELGSRITPHRASVTALPFDDGSTDLIISNETYGVIYDLAPFFDEIARVLAPGGAVVLAEANDVLNPRLARRARELWAAYERGPAGTSVHGHRIDVPYVERRAEIVRRALPDAADEDVRSLAEGTYAMTEDEIVAACRTFAETGALPSSRFSASAPPVDPAGMRVEAPVDPRWIRAELERRGLRARVVGYWGGAHGNVLVRAVNRALTALGPVFLRTAPAVRVVARKPS